jgi:hypothetical protein
MGMRLGPSFKLRVLEKRELRRICTPDSVKEWRKLNNRSFVSCPLLQISLMQ